MWTAALWKEAPRPTHDPRETEARWEGLVQGPGGARAWTRSLSRGDVLWRRPWQNLLELWSQARWAASAQCGQRSRAGWTPRRTQLRRTHRTALGTARLPPNPRDQQGTRNHRDTGHCEGSGVTRENSQILDILSMKWEAGHQLGGRRGRKPALPSSGHGIREAGEEARREPRRGSSSYAGACPTSHCKIKVSQTQVHLTPPAGPAPPCPGHGRQPAVGKIDGHAGFCEIPALWGSLSLQVSGSPSWLWCHSLLLTLAQWPSTLQPMSLLRAALAHPQPGNFPGPRW